MHALVVNGKWASCGVLRRSDACPVSFSGILRHSVAFCGVLRRFVAICYIRQTDVCYDLNASFYMTYLWDINICSSNRGCMTTSVHDHFGQWPLRSMITSVQKLVMVSWTEVVMDRSGDIMTHLVMDRSGHGPIWSWTDLVMDWSGHQPIWSWTDLVMDRSGPINYI